MIEVSVYREEDGYDDEILWVQQLGYEGAWLTHNDPRFAKLKPILDLMPEKTPDEWDVLWSFGWVKTLKMTAAEWDAITDGALVP